jgi:ABC-type uncharacterized transport system permease subunit
MPLLPLLLSLACYVVAALAALTPADQPQRLRFVLPLGCAALLAHLFTLYAHGRIAGSFDLHLFNALSAMAALCVAILLVLMLLRRVQRLAAVVFPIAALCLLLGALATPQTAVRGIDDWRIATHATLAVLAFATLSIAAVVAIQLQIQDQALRTRRLSRWFSGAPPLVQVEQLLFQMIGAGFVLLTLALLTGVLFVEDLMGQHLAHKTVLSAIAWCVFGVLLLGRLRGRLRFGWRGRRAVRLVLAGMALLVLAYFGSKFVLELVLKRAA